MDLSAYFNRIGFDISKLTKTNLELLEDLQNQHILSIPFENLDVMNNIPIVLKEELLFNKIINNNRGGFCFEQNGLFYQVLIELGFNVWMSEASVYINRQNRFGGMRNHMILIVRLDEDYLVDVGFGRSSRKPLPLITREITSIDGTFRVITLNDNEKAVEYFSEGGWHIQYKFHINPINLSDFQENCDWIQSSSDSMFTQGRLITQGTESGRITLEEEFFRIRDGERITEKQIKASDQFIYYLKFFNLRN